MLPLGDVLIDQSDQLQLLGQLIESGRSAKLNHASMQRLGGGLLEAFEQGICGAKVLEDDRPGTTVHASGFDEVVVGMAVDDSALEAGHIFGVYVAQFGLIEELPQYIGYLKRYQEQGV